MKFLLALIPLLFVPLSAAAVTVVEQFGIEGSVFRGGQVDWRNGAGLTVEFEDADIWIDEEPEISTGSPIYVTFPLSMPGDIVRVNLQLNYCDVGCGIRGTPGVSIESDDYVDFGSIPAFPVDETFEVTFDLPANGNELFVFWFDPYAEGDELPSISVNFSDASRVDVIPLPMSGLLLFGGLGAFGLIRRGKSARSS